MPSTLIDPIAYLPPETTQVVGVWVAALLTLAVLSYILGDNPLFRLAQYLFVGVAAGYAAALAWNHVLWPRALLLLSDPVGYWYYGLFFLLGLMLLARGVGAITVLGNLPLGVLFGTGAGLALGGTLTGTLVPQVGATMLPLSGVGWASAVNRLLLALGTIATLSAFHFTSRGKRALGRVVQGAIGLLGGIGRKVIVIAFGALLAGALFTFFTVLRSRIDFLYFEWLPLLGNLGL
jgi:hypothetical protein